MEYTIAKKDSSTVHILPTRIRETANIDLSNWARTESESYLRGRQLKGTTTPVEGTVLRKQGQKFVSVLDVNKVVDWDCGVWSTKLSEWSHVNSAIMD